MITAYMRNGAGGTSKCIVNDADGTIRIGALNWAHPGWEDTYDSHLYWDDPNDDGQDWQFDDITHWMSLPPIPTC